MDNQKAQAQTILRENPINDLKPERVLDDGYYNDSGKIRLSSVKDSLQYARLDIPKIREIYREWVDDDEGMVLHTYPESNRESNCVLVKCAKRGNDVYRWRINKRFKEVESLSDDSLEFFKDGELSPTTQCISITFIFDIKRCSVADAWKNIGHDYNRAVSWIRRKYGNCSVFRIWEAFSSGYPHIHSIFLFDEYRFSVFKDNRGNNRVREKKKLEGSYHSFIDVQPVKNLGNGFRYLLKYLKKVHNRDNPKHEITLSMLWLYQKRAYGLSGRFLTRLRLIRLRLDTLLMHNSNKRGQMTLSGLPLKKLIWVYDGIMSWNTALSYRVDSQKSRNDRWNYRLKKVPDELFV